MVTEAGRQSQGLVVVLNARLQKYSQVYPTPCLGLTSYPVFLFQPYVAALHLLSGTTLETIPPAFTDPVSAYNHQHQPFPRQPRLCSKFASELLNLLVLNVFPQRTRFPATIGKVEQQGSITERDPDWKHGDPEGVFG